MYLVIYLLILSAHEYAVGVKMLIKYDPWVRNTRVFDGYQEIFNTIYVDGKEKKLMEPGYIVSVEEITYASATEEQIASFYNFRKLQTVSMQENNQRVIPNFRNLPKLTRVEIKKCKLTSIDKNSLSNTPIEILDLQRNEISVIEDGAFGKKLRFLSLRCNNLQEINVNWFRNASSLQWFNVESNKVRQLQPKLFEKFKHLTEIYLARNEIFTLGEGCFSGSRFYHVLDLGSNDISEIKADVFAANHTLIDNIRISFNRLSFIESDVMYRVTVANSSVMYGNPWQCPCVKGIRDWLPYTNVKYIIDGEPSCVFTENYNQTCIHKVIEELYNTYVANLGTTDHRTCGKHEIANIGADKVGKTVFNMTQFWYWGDNIDLR